MLRGAKLVAGVGDEAPLAEEGLFTPRRMQLMLEAERLLIAEDAGLGPMFFEGEVRLIESFVKNFVYQPYGGALDVKLWRVS